MTCAKFVSRGFILGLVIAAALVSLSCDNGYGMGVGMDYGARWGGGASGPAVLVGGPTR
jgi:hypothetical protein